jgi:hypothetical protein
MDLFMNKSSFQRVLLIISFFAVAGIGFNPFFSKGNLKVILQKARKAQKVNFLFLYSPYSAVKK